MLHSIAGDTFSNHEEVSPIFMKNFEKIIFDSTISSGIFIQLIYS